MLVPLEVVIGTGGAVGLLLLILILLAIVYFAKRV
jgi:cbb3-type cytochrome oxidase subunit 3